MAKIPKLPEGATVWEAEDSTPQVLRAASAPQKVSVESRGIYDHAKLSEVRARYWLSMDGWTAKESALLLCAIDPGAIELLEARPGGTEQILRLDWPLHFDDLHRLVVRAVEAGVLSDLAAPVEVLRWADRKDLRMPASFVADLPDVRSAASPARKVPVSREMANRSAILAQLAADGFDPKALPAALPGLPNEAKQRARKALAKMKPPVSEESFKKGWQALRDSGEIVDV